MTVSIASSVHVGATFTSSYTVSAYTPAAGSNRAVVIIFGNTNSSGTQNPTVAWGTATTANGQIVLAAAGALGTQEDLRIWYVLEANLNPGSNIVVTLPSRRRKLRL